MPSTATVYVADREFVRIRMLGSADDLAEDDELWECPNVCLLYFAYFQREGRCERRDVTITRDISREELFGVVHT